MPGPGNSIMRNLSTVLREPVFKGAFPAMLREPLIGRRSETLMDESIGSFISRRFGVSLADNLVSAICHGIYAGDIYKLSARSILSVAWEVEKRQGSLVLAFLQKKPVPHLKEDIELMKQPRSVALKGSSIYTFVGGLGSLADALVIELMKNHNVKIRKNTWIKKIEGPKRELGMKVRVL